MTELELVQHAKTYLDKMANGVDPLTGEPINEGDLLNNVRISRCLFYVSGILEKVIANGGYVGTKPKVVKEEFALPDGAAASFRFSDKPIPVSEIAARLNELKQRENMKDLTGAKIADWLAAKGILEIRQDQQGKKHKETELTEDIGRCRRRGGHPQPEAPEPHGHSQPEQDELPYEKRDSLASQSALQRRQGRFPPVCHSLRMLVQIEICVALVH